MSRTELIPHLFRTEFTKIVSVLCKTYGMSNVQLAEDIVSDTFLTATETWSFKGIPKNPSAWLYKVAKNKTKDHFKREALFRTKIKPHLNQKEDVSQAELDLSESNIKDSQLEMMFAICNPILSQKAQITMALRILCGFSSKEIAHALLENQETINKRLARSKETFKNDRYEIRALSKIDITMRLENVLTILYLLFNEGYYASNADIKVRRDLCLEAMRLCYFLLDIDITKQSNTHALLALFCFHASRFDARFKISGETILYDDQDSGLWDIDLILKGQQQLMTAKNLTASGKYYLEACIAFCHTNQKDTKQKWETILQFYNQLLQLDYTPIAALNRTYALYKVHGKNIALKEALKISLPENHFYHILLAELYSDQQPDKQKMHLQMALKIAPSSTEKDILTAKIKALEI